MSRGMVCGLLVFIWKRPNWPCFIFIQLKPNQQGHMPLIIPKSKPRMYALAKASSQPHLYLIQNKKILFKMTILLNT